MYSLASLCYVAAGASADRPFLSLTAPPHLGAVCALISYLKPVDSGTLWRSAPPGSWHLDLHLAPPSFWVIGGLETEEKGAGEVNLTLAGPEQALGRA
jgi:hypothetical protein